MALFKEQPKRNGRCACCTNPRHNGYFKGTDQLTIQERRYAAPSQGGSSRISTRDTGRRQGTKSASAAKKVPRVLVRLALWR